MDGVNIMTANCLNCKDKERCMGFMYTPFVNCKYYEPIRDENIVIRPPIPNLNKINKESNND